MRKIIISAAILLTLTLPIFAFDGFADIFDAPVEEVSVSSSSKSGFAITGSAGFSLEGFIDQTNPKDSAVDIGGGLDIDLSWRGSIVDAKANFSLRPSLENELSWIDVFTGLSIATFFEGGRVEAGLLKKEWGSGDGVHVVDVINAPDYRYGIVDDPLAMKVAEPMLYTTIGWNKSSFDLFYKPMLIPMLSEEDPEGRWSMMSTDALTEQFAPLSFKIAIGNSPTTEELSQLSKYQFGARFKQTLGPFDLGVIYYNGYHYQPSYYVNNIDVDMLNPLGPSASATIDVDFTRAQLFGLEATFVTGPLTFMVEGGFWLSEDFKNEKPDKFNNRWVYLAGMGIMIPGTSVYASVTYNGHYIMDFNEFTMGTTTDIPVDTLQALLSSDGKGYLNTITAAIEVPLAREKVNIRLAGTYQIETQGFSLLPSVKWNISDDLVFKASGRVLGSIGEGSPSIFESWKDNSSAKLEIAYLF
ncbi:MAG: hypothetical protein WCY52_00270 [Sphaerochaetaceae bacterium]